MTSILSTGISTSKANKKTSSARPWVVFSSSSGQTFYKTWRALKPETQASFRGLCVDRKCGALTIAKEFLRDDQIFDFSAPSKEIFEKTFLHCDMNKEEPMIFLIGYFRLISADFLQKVSAVVNTHPSLLPAFPGLDKKVHEAAFQQTLISGFSVHLVNESMDAGPIIFQRSVDSSGLGSVEALREKVRGVEQKYLPTIIDQLVVTDLRAEDRQLTTRALQNREGFPIKCAD